MRELVVEDAARRLRETGSSNARLEAQLLLVRVLGCSRTELLAHPERDLSPEQEQAFQTLLARRLAGEPTAYILGTREFYGRDFSVDRRVLIPRPETELLVDIGKAAVARWLGAGVSEPRVVDVGTGSGAIAVTLAAECGIHVIATDVSSDALDVARANAVRHGVNGLVELIETDLLVGLQGQLHVVLANLPYVPRDRELPRDVSDYEPALALYAGHLGTELIQRLLREAAPVLAPGAELALELDEQEQATRVAALARELYPSAEVSICRDASGYDRALRIVVG